MPLFEFTCTECHTTFEHLVRTGRNQSEVVCPICKSVKTQKRLSAFAVSAGASTSHSASAANCLPGGT